MLDILGKLEEPRPIVLVPYDELKIFFGMLLQSHMRHKSGPSASPD